MRIRLITQIALVLLTGLSVAHAGETTVKSRKGDCSITRNESNTTGDVTIRVEGIVDQTGKPGWSDFTIEGSLLPLKEGLKQKTILHRGYGDTSEISYRYGELKSVEVLNSNYTTDSITIETSPDLSKILGFSYRRTPHLLIALFAEPVTFSCKL